METSKSVSVQVRDDEGNFLFRKEWLNNYVVIDGPMSKVLLTVTSTPNLYDPKDGSSKRFIVNTKAILRSDLPELKKKFGKAAYIKADELNSLFLSGTIWVNEGQTPAVPMKGEQILCNIGIVHSPALDKDVLRITNIGVAAPIEAPKMDVSALWADDPDGDFAKANVEAFENAAAMPKK
jgi:hypothetical protein